ncbi:MAG: hypothetical protein ABIQ70_09820 [Dokdonella sp.]
MDQRLHEKQRLHDFRHRLPGLAVGHAPLERQVCPTLDQGHAALTIVGDALMDALVAHRTLAATDYLIRIPVCAQPRFNLLPLLGIDRWLRPGCAT